MEALARTNISKGNIILPSRAKKLLKKKITSILRNCGYDLTPIWQLHERPLVDHLRKLFDHLQIECVLDVGGNKGQFADLLRNRVNFRGNIVTFEPVSQYVNILRNISHTDENWHICNYALGAESGEQTIHVTRSPGLNSFFTPKSAEVIGTETVRINTLDHALWELSIDPDYTPTYLKLDTQGFDLNVLAGARDSLPCFRALQTEASVRAIYEGMPSYRHAIDMLNANGFELSGLFPVELDDQLRLIEFDCVAVNSRFIDDDH